MISTKSSTLFDKIIDYCKIVVFIFVITVYNNIRNSFICNKRNAYIATTLLR